MNKTLLCFILRCTAMHATSYTSQSIVCNLSRGFALPVSHRPSGRTRDALRALNWLRWLLDSFGVLGKVKQSRDINCFEGRL
uniref:Putative secreted protein n=1 Tax=Ixodes ricinus TaxID=34613 RepID=A0A6B0U7G7_IXORI